MVGFGSGFDLFICKFNVLLAFPSGFLFVGNPSEDEMYFKGL